MISQATILLPAVLLPRVYRLVIRPSHPRQLSLAIRPWLGKMSTGDDCNHRWEEMAGSARRQTSSMPKFSSLSSSSSKLLSICL